MAIFRDNRFIERSIVSALSLLREHILSDEYALKNGLMQRLSPRLKAAIIFSVLVFVLFLKDISLLIILYCICLLLAIFSGIKPGFFLKRTWFFIPLFSLIIVVPAIFAPFTAGEALVTFRLAGLTLVITKPGLQGAILFVARVAVSVSFSVLLSITTRHSELLAALRHMGLPQIFIFTLGMCYRYIYLFAGLVENTFKAIKCRTIVGMHYKKGQHVVTWNIAYLWMRSLKLSEDVYNAMLARGFRGEPKSTVGEV